MGDHTKWHITTQINFDPTKPEDGTFMWNWQQSISPGIYFKNTLSRKIRQKLSLFHNTKGFNDYTQVGHLLFPDAIFYGTFKSKFNFISFQHNLSYRLIHGKKASFDFYGGYELSYLINYLIDVGINKNRLRGNAYMTGRYPYNEYMDFTKLNLSGQIGFGLDINDGMELNIYHSRDITRFVDRDKLIVHNWSFNLQLAMNIKEIIAKKNE